jgi:hypothetical protein
VKAEYAYSRQFFGPVRSLLIAAEAEVQYAVRHWLSDLLWRASERLIRRWKP